MQEISQGQTIITENKIREEVNNKFNRSFGFVIASSGISINKRNNNIRDWALIELHDGRFNKKPLNQVSLRKYYSKASQLPRH
jgi:hypothetical protein